MSTQQPSPPRRSSTAPLVRLAETPSATNAQPPISTYRRAHTLGAGTARNPPQPAQDNERPRGTRARSPGAPGRGLPSSPPGRWTSARSSASSAQRRPFVRRTVRAAVHPRSASPSGKAPRPSCPATPVARPLARVALPGAPNLREHRGSRIRATALAILPRVARPLRDETIAPPGAVRARDHRERSLEEPRFGGPNSSATTKAGHLARPALACRHFCCGSPASGSGSARVGSPG